MANLAPDDPENTGDRPDDDAFPPALDDDFVRGGHREPSADERIARAQRIARNNDRLRAAGEIADGTGRPGIRRRRPRTLWIAAAIAAGVIVLAVVVSIVR